MKQENKKQLENNIMESVFNFLQNKTALKFDKIMLINNNIYLGDLSSFNIIKIEYKDGYLIELIKVWDNLNHFKVVNEDIKFIIENKFEFELSEKGYHLKRTVDNRDELLEVLNGPVNRIINTLGSYKNKKKDEI